MAKFFHPRKDLTGKQFCFLTVTRLAGKNKHGQYTYWCRCVCGKALIVVGQNLTSGNTKSCGCKKHDSSTWRRKNTPIVIPDWLKPKNNQKNEA